MFQKAYVGTLASCGPEHPDTVEFLNHLNVAKNKLLMWPRSSSSISSTDRDEADYMGPSSLAYAFQSDTESASTAIPILIHH
jgi:hypothetical protein